MFVMHQNNHLAVYFLGWFFFVALPQNVLSQELKTNDYFIEEFADFPRKEKNLRKWDAPVVADLVQDGYPDLILNDHGLGISICWNNNGKYAKPYDLTMGDLHGVTVGDLDFDGNLEMVVSRGGGSGSNARNSMVFKITKQREFIRLPELNSPLETMRGRTVKFFDGDNDGDLDLLNFAFPSNDKKGKSENYVYENDGKGQLVLASTLPPIKMDGQKTLLTDFNGDNISDIILFGHGSIKMYQGKGDLSFEDKTEQLIPNPIEEVTAIVELDYDNDGDFDLYLTRGKEFEIGETFYNKQTKTWGFFTKRGAFEFEDLDVGDVLTMSNFQSQWPYNDAYYIGETAYPYNFPGETHSGKDIRLVNSDALGFPDHLNVNGGIHIGYVGNQKWRIAGNTHSSTTGVVNGVFNYTKYAHPEGLQDILLENKNGRYIDVTQKVGILSKEHAVGASVADFDNNGYQDILIIRRGELVYENDPILYLNQGNSKFEKLTNIGLSTSDLGSIGMAVADLDYNLDGKVDVVIGNERGKWHLFKNMVPNLEKNKYITVVVGNSSSGKVTGLGALVSIKGCMGEQIKRVGETGAAYSQSFNNQVHFGMGTCSNSAMLKVTWSKGETLERKISTFNTMIEIGKKN